MKWIRFKVNKKSENGEPWSTFAVHNHEETECAEE